MYLSLDTVEAFAAKRNPTLSFPFFKENGELLCITSNLGCLADPRALDAYQEFYDNASVLMDCYPQYYRFFLGIVLDLESLGLQGNVGATLCETTSQNSLLFYDTSDLRRMEALSLISSRRELTQDEHNLRAKTYDSINNFIARPDHFTKFNRPFFYDLTHFIFYLTDYGRNPFPLDNSPIQCLHYIGLLALLDSDEDLLAEAGICLNYMGHEIPSFWDRDLTGFKNEISIVYDETVQSALNPAVDEYHSYFVLNWYYGVTGREVFTERFNGRTPNFSVPPKPTSLLSKISSYVHKSAIGTLNGAQTDWESHFNEDEHTRLRAITASSKHGAELLAQLSNGMMRL